MATHYSILAWRIPWTEEPGKLQYVAALGLDHQRTPDCITVTDHVLKGLLWWVSSKESAYNAGDVGSIPGSGRSPGERNGNPLQYSCLENPMDRGAWQAIVHDIAKGRT